MIVKLNTIRLKLAIARTSRKLKDRRRVYDNIGRAMRRYIHDTIRMQGRRAAWKGLSDWTKARTGKRKALLGLIPLIQYRATSRSAQVIFAKTGARWKVEQHHRGYVAKAVVYKPSRKTMRVPIARGGKPRFFKSRKKARTPSRKFIPTRGEINKVTLPIVEKYVARAVREGWK